MNSVRKYFVTLCPLLIVLIISFVCRFIYLDRVPTGITNDELDYVLNAKSIWLSGSDIGQQWNPLSFTPPTSTFPMAELPSVILSPFVGPFSLSLLHARWGYALIGVLLTTILYFLAYYLFNSRTIALIVGIAASINPWGIFFSRTALEAPIAVTLFYLFFLLSIQTSKSIQLLSIIPFIIGFFSYIGTKLLSIPIAIIPPFYLLISKLHNIRFSLILLITSIIITAFYVRTNFSNPSRSRMNEIFLPTSSSVADSVNVERKNTLSSPFYYLFSNKFSSYANISISKYLNAFSPNTLFLNGDSRSAFSVWDHGYFYLADIAFLFIGICYMFKSHKKQLLLLTSIILISPLPSVASIVGISYPLRSSLMFPALICIIGYGIAQSLINIRSKSLLKFCIFTLIFIYSILTLRYFNIYLYRNPIANSEGFDFSSRIVSSYLTRSKTQRTIVLTGSPITLYKHLLFYSNGYQSNNFHQVALNMQNKQFTINNASFEMCEDTNIVESNTTYIVQAFKICNALFHQKNRLQIAQVSDSGSIYFIYNDILCKDYKPNPYIRIPSFNHFSIDKLSDEIFCKTFITNNN